MTDTKALSHFLAGATSGGVSTILLQPLDVVRTRMQMSEAFGRSVGIINQLGTAPNSGVWKTAAAIVRKDRIFGLYRGVTPSLLKNTCGNGMYFLFLRKVNALLQAEDGSVSSFGKLIAGASARSLSAVVVCPLSVISTRFELLELATKYSGIWHAFTTIMRKEGLSGLFAGVLPTVARDAPYSALYYLFYLQLRDLFAPWNSDDPHSWRRSVINFTAGMSAGGAATLLTQPQDVAKTRMQASRHSLGKQDKYATVPATVRRIFNEEGVYGFFRGGWPRFIKRCLGSAISWTIYEYMVSFYDVRLNKLMTDSTNF
mmetsp:Transcript_6365/g.19244  ORF Transcript_6365/g.19244 Transcript_6365/m.19244 type:complete len:315 (+) Transcript_6365:115-1059(+)|eukprot:CAMPEP_0198733908 /NCGR_PEP_ID=MMETSP1475-20131203/49088_1 /TAXON_ID= ORGANISM="Unidentified sp., Strain CCMP1999" /NCGR_SAMPLE_ID=MMETSP1475 /ASSEMBLY_ACC=CAM_ASM_001111 /LENGTH=314 /DNA_ID=CAMNT_0044497281 /DNA_START=71 /DNA_END=1015 /DNA_ORIENTATION=+